MVISVNSQLGLMEFDKHMMLEYLQDHKTLSERELKFIDNEIESMKGADDEYSLPKNKEDDGNYWLREISARLGYVKENMYSEFYTVKHPNANYYLIQSSVETCAAVIKIKEDFSCAIFNKAKDGEHVYLLGKNEFFRYVKLNGALRATYWNRVKHIAFEFGFHLEKDRYYFPHTEPEIFNRLVRLMIFVELGDIDVEVIEGGRNNGKPKKNGKITNTSNNTVYVVDSSWNKLIIRTDGFAVRGHFRLQPCGHNMADRKLIWVDAFEKHGYTRRPKAEIIR